MDSTTVVGSTVGWTDREPTIERHAADEGDSDDGDGDAGEREHARPLTERDADRDRHDRGDDTGDGSDDGHVAAGERDVEPDDGDAAREPGGQPAPHGGRRGVPTTRGTGRSAAAIGRHRRASPTNAMATGADRRLARPPMKSEVP